MANPFVSPNPPKRSYYAPGMGALVFVRWAAGEEPLRNNGFALNAQIQSDEACGYQTELVSLDTYRGAED